MEILRVVRNPFGLESVAGVSWDLLWPFLGASIAFIVLHAVLTPILSRLAKRTNDRGNS